MILYVCGCMGLPIKVIINENTSWFSKVSLRFYRFRYLSYTTDSRLVEFLIVLGHTGDELGANELRPLGQGA